MNQDMFNALEDSVKLFNNQFNNNSTIQEMLKGWETVIEVCSSDLDKSIKLNVEDGKISQTTDRETVSKIEILGNSNILTDFFLGKLDASLAVAEEKLSISADQDDMMKLQAINFVLKANKAE